MIGHCNCSANLQKKSIENAARIGMDAPAHNVGERRCGTWCSKALIRRIAAHRRLKIEKSTPQDGSPKLKTAQVYFYRIAQASVSSPVSALRQKLSSPLGGLNVVECAGTSSNALLSRPEKPWTPGTGANACPFSAHEYDTSMTSRDGNLPE
jgi:hypothetical protein